MSNHRCLVWLGLTIFLAPTTALAQLETVAHDSAIIMRNGPRTGAAGKNYLNAQGKKSGAEGRYSSFGIIGFHAPRNVKLDKIKGLTLALTESIPQFAKDGKIKIYLTTDTRTPTDSADLKFDGSSDDGLGDQLQPRFLLGSGEFTKQSTGKVDTFKLTVDGEAELYLRGQLNRGSDVRLLLAPDSDDVAATYFGAGNAAASNRPRLTIDAEPAQ